MRILSIETSCDETAISVVEGQKISDTQADFKLLGNALHSQIPDHREFGGVYPNVARREHTKNILPLLDIATSKANIFQHSEECWNIRSEGKEVILNDWLSRESELAHDLFRFVENRPRPKIDAIAVTAGPGLAPALWVGINVARSLAHLWDIPLVAVNHMAGHVLSGLWPSKALATPALGLLVSGGHTEIVKVNSPTDFEKIGKTLDDAAGEAFDKVARMLGLLYPGGPEISKLAAVHHREYPNYQHRYDLPLPMQHSGDLNFSFSGLKTAAKKVIDNNKLEEGFVKSFSREFEETVIEILILKLEQAINEYIPTQILCGGGVIVNRYLRQQLDKLATKNNLEILYPDASLTGDNAVMIAMAGFWLFDANQLISPHHIKAVSSWSIDTIFL